MGTKNNPGKYDCYVKAEADEPMFVLLARDPLAANLVEEWAANNIGSEPQNEKMAEAFQVASDMRNWFILKFPERASELHETRLVQTKGKKKTP